MSNFLYDTAVLVTELEISLLLIILILVGVFLMYGVIKAICVGLVLEYKYYKRTKQERKLNNE